MKGMGMEKDPAQGVQYYKLAAEQV